MNITFDRYEELAGERNAKGLDSIVPLLTVEELELYKKDVISGIENRKERIVSGKGGISVATLEETIATLEKIIVEIDNRLAEEKGSVTGLEVIEKFIEVITAKEIEFFFNLKKNYTYKQLQKMFYSKEINKSVFSLATESKTRIEDCIKREMDVKKAKLLNTIANKVGEVITCDLRMNNNGSFDGTITGTDKTIKISTIVAGGYNIQRVHYRTIVK